MHDYARSEIRRFGGPNHTDDFWQVWEHGSRLLPPQAVRWIVTGANAESLREPVQEDPRAAYSKRQHWPYR